MAGGAACKLARMMMNSLCKALIVCAMQEQDRSARRERSLHEREPHVVNGNMMEQ
jgi:NADH:ubiquinone oxidoreductase subunit F (NADH-binding)